MKEATSLRASVGIVIMAGSLGLPLAVREDLASIAAELHRPPEPGEPPHTHNEVPVFPEGLLDHGSVVGSTATAVSVPPLGWTPRS